MVQAKVKEDGFTFCYKWLCFPCLLRQTGVLNKFGDYNRIVAMKVTDAVD
jgi:hypothetical protein